MALQNEVLPQVQRVGRIAQRVDEVLPELRDRKVVIGPRNPDVQLIGACGLKPVRRKSVKSQFYFSMSQ